MRVFLETERLLLRPHRLSDVPFMMELNADPEVVRYTGDVAFTHEDEAVAVVRSLQRQFEERRMGRLLCIERATGQPVGWTGLKQHDDHVDLGFRFLRRVWGRGYATEAGRVCLAWAEENARAPVVANAMPENTGSVRVLQKLGFVAVGSFDDGFQRFERG